MPVDESKGISRDLHLFLADNVCNFGVHNFGSGYLFNLHEIWIIYDFTYCYRSLLLKTAMLVINSV